MQPSRRAAWRWTKSPLIDSVRHAGKGKRLSIDVNETLSTEANTALRLVSGKGPEYLLPLRHPVRSVRALASRQKSSPLPGPVGLPGIGVWREYNRDPAAYVRRAAQRYGDIFRLPLPMADLVVLNHPKHYEITHIANDQRFSSLTSARMEKFFGVIIGLTGTPTTNPRRIVDEINLQRRSQLVPILARRSLALVASTFVDEFIQRTAKWTEWADSGRTVDLQEAIAPVILAAFLRSMCSTEFSDDQMTQIDHDLRTLLAAGGSFGFAPTHIVEGTSPRQTVSALRRTLRTTAQMLDERLASNVDHDDLLDKVLKFTGLNGRPLVRAELIYLLILLLTGGYDTLVASLSWMFGLLSLNPEPAERLYTEIDALNGKVPAFDDLKLLPWTKACFDEAQRLQGGPVHKTQAIVDVDIDGYHFPSGTVFGLGWTSMHRDERWWPNPDRYDPARFTDPAVVAARPKTAFVPFGVGKLACPGQAMAYANAQLLSAVILQRFRFSVPPGWQPKPLFAGSTPVKGGVPVTVTRAANQ